MGSGIWIAIALVALLAGLGIGFWIGRLQQGSTEERLSEVEKDFDAYKARVTEHFSQSAAHFNSIGQQYRELYEHMANGSKNLCREDASERKFPAPEMVAAVSHASATEADSETIIETEAPVEISEVETEEPVVVEASVESEAEDTVEQQTADSGTAEKDETVNSADVGSDDVNLSEAQAANESSASEADATIAQDDETDKESRLYH